MNTLIKLFQSRAMLINNQHQFAIKAAKQNHRYTDTTLLSFKNFQFKINSIESKISNRINQKVEKNNKF